MHVSVKRTGDGAFVVEIGETRATTDEFGLKLLLLEGANALGGHVVSEGQNGQMASHLARRIKAASDIGIQAFLHTAEEDDVLFLLKLAGGDGALRTKLYSNMSDRSRTMFEEDFDFRFSDESVDAGEAAAGLRRLEVALDDLERRGLLGERSG